MFLLLYIFLVKIVQGDFNVKYVAIIYRHGDRTPVDTYPTDPWRNESLWPEKFGQLTNIGKMQHYAFGEYLRQRYSHLISHKYDPDEIYVRSTDVDRTLMSAQVNLAGMYPPCDKSIWNSNLLWQPLPIHTVPETEDAILAMKKKCPAYDEEFKIFTHSQGYRDRLKKYQDLMDYVSAYSGMKVKDYGDILDIYTTLKIEALYNFSLPKWTQSVFPDKLREPACYSFTVDTGTPKLARLKIGPLLKQIVSNMYKVMHHNASNSKSNLKVSIFSGHDLTIGNMLNGLGIYDGNCPVYASAILMELLYDSDTNTYFVRIVYKNTTEVEEPTILRIPYCGRTCPIERFINLYANILSVKWERECLKQVQFTSVFGATFIFGILLFLIVYLLHKISFAMLFPRQKLEMSYTILTTPNQPECQMTSG